MTDNEIDAKFLALKIELDQAQAAIAELKAQAKRHNAAAQKRHDELLAAVKAA